MEVMSSILWGCFRRRNHCRSTDRQANAGSDYFSASWKEVAD
jgi:hypothetical protein